MDGAVGEGVAAAKAGVDLVVVVEAAATFQVVAAGEGVVDPTSAVAAGTVLVVGMVVVVGCEACNNWAAFDWDSVVRASEDDSSWAAHFSSA